MKKSLRFASAALAVALAASCAAPAFAAGSSFTPIFILCAGVCVVPVILMSWLHWFCGKAGKNI